MKFGLDLDDTINAAPEQFAAICNALMDAGHEVHVITYRHPIYHKEQTIEELKSYGLRYTDLHLTGEKEELCKLYKIDMALDDYASWHYPNCWRFTIGFVLPQKKGTPYLQHRSHRSRKMSATYSEETLDSHDKDRTYKDGFDAGFGEGYDQAQDDLNKEEKE